MSLVILLLLARVCALGNNIKAVIHYRVPNVEEYLIQGEFWIKRITRTASNIMSKLENKKTTLSNKVFLHR